MRPPALEYVRPETLAQAVALLAGDADAAPVAGGQSLVPMLSLRVAGARRLVDVGRLADLAGVRGGEAEVVIGAATTHAALEDGISPDPSGGMLAHVASGIAYRSVRHFGTIGGAMCLADPAADWPVCLMALGAVLHLVGPEGERVVPADGFVTGAYTTVRQHAELLCAIALPRDEPHWGWAKVARKQGAYADSLAAAVRRGDAAPVVVLGSTGTGARRLPATEAAVAAQRADLAEVIRRDVAAADPDADAIRLHWHEANVARAIARMGGA